MLGIDLMTSKTVTHGMVDFDGPSFIDVELSCGYVDTQTYDTQMAVTAVCAKQL